MTTRGWAVPLWPEGRWPWKEEEEEERREVEEGSSSTSTRRRASRESGNVEVISLLENLGTKRFISFYFCSINIGFTNSTSGEEGGEGGEGDASEGRVTCVRGKCVRHSGVSVDIRIKTAGEEGEGAGGADNPIFKKLKQL